LVKVAINQTQQQ